MTSRLVFAALLGALLAGCAGPLEDPERFAGYAADGCSADYVEQNLFVPRCGGAGCHGNDSPANGLDLVSPGVALRLSSRKSASCGAQPMATYLREKVQPKPSCGSQMPLLGDKLTALELACLSSYLDALPSSGK